MNSKVDFAAGGIVVDNNKVLLVKNKKSEYVDDPKSFWGFPKGHMAVSYTHLTLPTKRIV